MSRQHRSRRISGIALAVAVAWSLGATPAAAVGTRVTSPMVPAAAPDQEGTGGGGSDRDQAAPQRPLHWAALGDSYSSGEGMNISDEEPTPDDERCYRSQQRAYAPLAKSMLEPAWEFERFDFFACTGAHATPGTGGDESDHLFEQRARLQDKYDLITLTIGGNDAGFADIMRDCVFPGEGTVATMDIGCNRLLHDWNTYHALRLDDERVGNVTLDGQAVTLLRGVESYEALHLELQARAAREAWELYVATIECDGPIQPCNQPGDIDAFDLSVAEYYDLLMPVFKQQLLDRMQLDTLRSTLVGEYTTLAQQNLALGGHIVVLGYPRLFEPASQWPINVERLTCELFEARFTEVFRDAADELNAIIQAAVDDAATVLTAPEANISFLPVADEFEEHNVCAAGGSDVEWVNSLTVGWDWGVPPSARPQASLHPNERGYEAVAGLLASHVGTFDWGEGAVVAHRDRLEVRTDGSEPNALNFGSPPVGGSATDVLSEALGPPVTQLPPWPDDDETPVVGESGGSTQPECWEEGYRISIWTDNAATPFFATLTTTAETVVGDEIIPSGALLGYRAYQGSEEIAFYDGIRIGATHDTLRGAYAERGGRQVYDVELTGDGPRGPNYELVELDQPVPVEGNIRFGPPLGTMSGRELSDTIVERGAGLNGIQCGLDLVPDVYGEIETNGDDEGDDDEPEPGECAARIGIVMDASPSIVDAGAEGQVRSAATGVVDALAESGAEVRVSAFAGFPVSLTSGWVSLADEEGLRLARQVVGSMAFEGQGTNWEAALMDMAGQDADVVVLVTDGNPNEYGVGITGSASLDGTTDFDPRALEAGVAAANDLRDQGAEVVAVGAGDVRADSLAQVAGPTEGEDYYVGDFGDLGPSLAEVAAQRCGVA